MIDTKERARSLLDYIRGARGEPSRLWLAGGALILLVLATRSCATVEAGQVAVRINNLTGGTEVITQPGLILQLPFGIHDVFIMDVTPQTLDRKSTRLNSSHVSISYAVFCLKKKKHNRKL